MKVLCLGDSNTYGFDPRGYFGGRYGRCWPQLLGELSGWEVVNLGENGMQIPRMEPVLPKGETVLVMLGTNDLLQGASAAEAGARMADFLQMLGREDREIVLICPVPMKRGAWVPTAELAGESVLLGERYAALAAALGIRFIDTRSWDIPLAYDGVHLTEAGHSRFAEMLWKELIK